MRQTINSIDTSSLYEVVSSLSRRELRREAEETSGGARGPPPSALHSHIDPCLLTQPLASSLPGLFACPHLHHLHPSASEPPVEDTRFTLATTPPPLSPAVRFSLHILPSPALVPSQPLGNGASTPPFTLPSPFPFEHTVASSFKQRPFQPRNG